MKYTRKVLTDVKAVIDLGVVKYRWMDDARYEKSLREAAADLTDFLRDHRSRDHYGIDIECVYEELCQYCFREPDEDADTNEPLCCRKAMEQWQAEEYCKLSL